MPHPLPKITIAILNYNGLIHLQNFLPSVMATNYGNFDILIIDNASTDGSVNWLKKFDKKLTINVLDKNYGFTGGYNKGLVNIDADYMVLLNSDVEVTPNWLLPLVSLASSDQKIAAIQPKILKFGKANEFEYAGAAGGYLDILGYPLCRGRIFEHIETDQQQYNNTQEVFWASGACLFIKANLFFELKGFDQDFFAHMEEIDLCWRLKNKGYRVYVCPQSIVYHLGGGTLTYGNPRKTFLNIRNSLLADLKNLPTAQAFKVVMLRLILDGLAGIKLLTEGKWTDTLAIVKAHFSFYTQLFNTIAKRKSLGKKLPLQNHSGVYKHSIVFASFIKKKKKFSTLKFDE